MIICKRPDLRDDHLQEIGSSIWSVARGRILQIIICKWLVHPDDHLQEACFSKWSFARGPILRMIICRRPDPLDDQLQEACPSVIGADLESEVWSWNQIFVPTLSTRFGQDFKVEVQAKFEAGVWSVFCCWCFVEVMKFNLGQDSGQDFEF